MEVFTAQDATSAAQLLEQNTPDLICLDDQLPGDEGLTFCEMVVASPDDVTCPVVVLAERTDRTAAPQSSEMCIYFLQKRPNLWRYLEPVIYELVDIQPATSRSNDPGRGISGLWRSSSEVRESCSLGSRRCALARLLQPEPCASRGGNAWPECGTVISAQPPIAVGLPPATLPRRAATPTTATCPSSPLPRTCQAPCRNMGGGLG